MVNCCVSLILLCAAGTFVHTTNIVRTAQVLNDTLRQGVVTNIPYDLQGVVTKTWPSEYQAIALKDQTGGFFLLNYGKVHPAVGDIIRARGHVKVARNLARWSYSGDVTIHGSGVLPPAQRVAIPDLRSGRFDWQRVIVAGTILDVLEDDVERNLAHIILLHEGQTITLLPTGNKDGVSVFREMIGSRIEATGVCAPHIGTWRSFAGYGVMVCPRDIRILAPAPADPFDTPPLEAASASDTANIYGLGRRSVDGTVVATWHGNRFLLNSPLHRIVEVTLAPNQPLPKPGEVVRVVGLPGTNLFTLDFANAIWRPEAGSPTPEDAPQDTSSDLLMPKADTYYKFLATRHGQAVRIKGLVRGVSSAQPDEATIHLESDARILPIDISSCPNAADGLALGTRIEATGVCNMLTDPWKPNAPLPSIRGFSVIVRRPQDIRILARPPWWTPGRLLVVIGSLLAALVAIVIWNRTLRRLVDRRSRQLLKAQIAQANEQLKVSERTRLAVELHDSLSQNLTGIACQITATKSALQKNSENARERLDTAERMLLSTRTELKRCLWDLRSDALGLSDFAEAIRQTVQPVIGPAELSVSCDVPRPQLLDATAHSILCIVRELAANAVRHGKARHVEVRGSRQAAALVFAVRDDGAGFDAAHAAGLSEGHFGLSGIRERTAHLEGTFDIASAHGKGTTATVTIPVPPSPANGKAAT